MALYPGGGGGHGGHGGGQRRPPPYPPIRDSWIHEVDSEQQNWSPVRHPADTDEIYESIYDSRWRLLNQEAARLQREQTWTPATMSPAPGSSSSRESSLDPTSCVVHTASASVLSTRSPRQIVIQRSDDGFGFTLRHFIVYPPDAEPTLDSNGVEIKEPLDTIFVKSVRESGPAHLAGLQCGDRIISVNGESVSGKSYAEVVILIQRLRDNLSLIVVPKQDDILQMYFSDIAQNPETNSRPPTVRESFQLAAGYLPGQPAAAPSSANASPHSQAYYRESSPYTEFVNNGPARIAMPHPPHSTNQYRVPEPVLPPWVTTSAGASVAASIASTPAGAGSTEHVYAMPARVIGTSGESLEQSHQHDPRSVGSLVSLDSSSTTPGASPWRTATSSTASTTASATRTLCDSKESVPNLDLSSPDPVISRIRRDFERKQEFLRTTNLPNYLGSPTHPHTEPGGQQAIAAASAVHSAQRTEAVESDSEFYVKQQQQGQQPTIVQPEDSRGRPPVYFGDRFPVQSVPPTNQQIQQQNLGRAIDDHQTDQSQFHLYGLQLGYRRSGRQFDEDEVYSGTSNTQQALSHHHLQHHSVHHHSQVHHPLFRESQQQQQQVQQQQYQQHRSNSNIQNNNNNNINPLANNPGCLTPTGTTYQSGNNPARQGQVYLNAHYDGSGTSSSTNITSSNTSRSSNGPVVLRRNKKKQHQNLVPDDEEERNLRRVSYLRATKEDRMHIDSDAEQDPNQHPQGHPHHQPHPHPSQQHHPQQPHGHQLQQHQQQQPQQPGEYVQQPSTPKHSTSEATDGQPRHPPSIQRIRALFGEKVDETSVSPSSNTAAQCHADSVREGWLHCKVTSIEGKKSVDRSWRNVYAVLTSDSLSAYKDKKIKTIQDSQATQNNQLSFTEEVPQIILSESGQTGEALEIADDYTKRKHVFRIKTNRSEVLYQAESEVAFQQWLTSLEAIVGPQRISRNARKLTSASTALASNTRNRSPTGHSPATKSRKPSSDQGPMTKETSNKKNWKGKVAKQWKRMHAGSSPAQGTTYPEGGSIGVPLEDCPMCPDLECVPLLVRTCCTMVEEKGLDIVGIYRVPGNSAAVNALTEQVNTRGEECLLKLDDPKWNDVNVVTSLLKSFFRKLPDPIFTTEMYNIFIDASKIEETHKRLNALRKLFYELPEVNYETLLHLVTHLSQVIAHCDTNKMEIRNLAIVFGPTLVRPADDNMMSMVTDMSHQCRIIESILTHYDWFFSDEDDLDENVVEVWTPTEKKFRLEEKTLDDGTILSSDPSAPVAIMEQHISNKNSGMDLVKLTDLCGGGTSTEMANQNVLLSNLQKLEDAGKMITGSSSNKDVSAKDIVSGIISAANRKMLRAATGSHQGKSSSTSGSASTNKKDSVDKSSSETSKSTQKLDTIDSSNKHHSRRNSESVFHGAVAIAAAVPQLMVNAGNSMSTSNLPTAHTATSQSSASNMDKLSSTASQENLINVESTVMSSSTSRIVSTAYYDESGFKEDSTGKKIKFPIESYQGLEKATAERVRRFVDETKANLLRGRLESSPNLSSSRTTSDAHVETWTDDLAGGILFQDDSYPVHAYNDRVQAQDRFLNLTYRTPNVIKTPERLLRANAAVALARGHPGGPQQLVHNANHGPHALTRGLSLGELSPRHPGLELKEFDTKKIATHGTLKRLKLVKSPTDTQLFVPNQVLLPHIDPSSESMLTSLTADFDEKMKLLLDPNYSGGSDTSSVQSTPSKYAKYAVRRVSEQPRPLSRGHLQSDQTDLQGGTHPNAGIPSKTNRSISLGEDSQNVCSEKQLSILNEQQQRNNKKSELKRGRLVDKNHPPKRANGDDDGTEASDSQNEEGKENKRVENFENSPNSNLDQQFNNYAQTPSSATAPESNRTQGKLRNRRLRRRHTVGGTKDFADIEIIDPSPQSEREQPVDMIGLDTYADDSNIGNGGSGRDSNPQTFERDLVFPNTSLYHHSVMMNVDRSLGQWIRRQQKIGKSSPDLSLIGRRLSLPDSVLAASAAFYPFTSLLESQV